MSGKPYDIVFLGAGINGAGMARDAALRGLRVALFDKNDFGSGTSSKSSKLVHGGLRYLEHREFGLVFESVNERAVQRKMAPHLVRPMPFLVPIYKDARTGLELMNIGLWIYDTLALFRSPKMHRTYRGDKAAELEPQLNKEGLVGAIEYHDCVTDDARLVLENVIAAEGAGADVHSYTEVTNILREDDKVSAVEVHDVLTGDKRTVRTRCVVVAAGAWTDEVGENIELNLGRKVLRRTKGVHVVFPGEMLPLRRASSLIHKDGRVMFAIPWKGRLVVGTTDTDYEGSVEDAHATADDVRYLCDGANGYFPEANFTPDKVISTWSGLRPLIDDEHAKKTGDVSREHEIFIKDDGVIVIAGGKLTTYRRMSRECVRKAVKWLRANHEDEFEGRKLSRPRTKRRPLPGAVGLEKNSMTGVRALAHDLVSEIGIDDKIANHLSVVYGTRSKKIARWIKDKPELGKPLQNDLPYVWAEVEFAIRDDLARTLDDVLSRRIPLLLVGLDQGLDVVDDVGKRCGELLGWSTEQTAQQIAAYKKSVADSRLFRTG